MAEIVFSSKWYDNQDENYQFNLEGTGYKEITIPYVLDKKKYTLNSMKLRFYLALNSAGNSYGPYKVQDIRNEQIYGSSDYNHRQTSLAA